MKPCCREVIKEIFEEIDRRLDETKTNTLSNNLLFSYETQMFRDNLREEFQTIKNQFLEMKITEEAVILSRIPTPKKVFKD